MTTQQVDKVEDRLTILHGEIILYKALLNARLLELRKLNVVAGRYSKARKRWRERKDQFHQELIKTSDRLLSYCRGDGGKVQDVPGDVIEQFADELRHMVGGKKNVQKDLTSTSVPPAPCR